MPIVNMWISKIATTSASNSKVIIIVIRIANNVIAIIHVV